MVTHVYLIKLRQGIDINEVVTKLKTLKDHAPEIQELIVAADFKHDGNSYDVAEICTFRDEEAFRTFGANSYHEQIRQYLRTVQTATAKVDYYQEI